MHAFEKRCDTAAEADNDSDLSEAIRLAQSELGVRVDTVNPQPRSPAMLNTPLNPGYNGIVSGEHGSGQVEVPRDAAMLR